MAEVLKDEGELVGHLNELIRLDLDAVEAYEAAISRLRDAGDKAQLDRFMGDHRRHVADLSPLVRDAGGTPAVAPDMKRVLTKGKVVILGMAGDMGVLEAMRSNEETTNRVYGKAKDLPGLPPQVKSALELNLSDEQRHLAWIEQRLSAMRKSEEGAARHP